MSSGRASDTIVVGGGAVGCAVAWYLAREGCGVTLLERDSIAAQASGAAAGMLLPIGEAPDDVAFRSLGLESLALFPELVEELRERSGVDPEFERCGALHLCVSDARARALRARAPELARFDVEWLDADACRATHEALAPDLRGALWSPHEAHVRSPLLTRAFAGAAECLGARVEQGVEVTGLVRDRSRVTGVRTASGIRSAGCVVVCTGAFSGALGAWLSAGDLGPAPIEPVRGQIVALDPERPLLSCLLVADEVYLVPKRDGTVIAGATEERAGFDCRVTAAGVGTLVAAACDRVPALRTATFRSAWAGLRPRAPDGLPLIGPVPGAPGLLLATGHHRNGVLLSPVTGRRVADFVLGKATASPSDRFRVGRSFD